MGKAVPIQWIKKRKKKERKEKKGGGGGGGYCLLCSFQLLSIHAVYRALGRPNFPKHSVQTKGRVKFLNKKIKKFIPLALPFYCSSRLYSIMLCS